MQRKMEMSPGFLVFFIFLAVVTRRVAPCSFFEVECDGCCRTACDGHVECMDGSDELPQLCSSRQCVRDESVKLIETFGLESDLGHIGRSFRCDYGGCITENLKCNGRVDCWDGSDETHELCKFQNCPNAFRCHYGACITKTRKCDGKVNCRDGSDETEECSEERCEAYEDRCDYGACIRKKKFCNGVVDCEDGSDETTKRCGDGHTARKIEATIRIPAAVQSPAKITTSLPPPPSPPLVTARTESVSSPKPPTSPVTPRTKAPSSPRTKAPSSPGTEAPASLQPPSDNIKSPASAETEPKHPTNIPPPSSSGGESLPLTPSSFPDDVFPLDETAGCDGVDLCSCYAPLQHFCVPCANVNQTCELIGVESVCSTETEILGGVEIDVLSCGPQESLDLTGFARKEGDPKCGTDTGMPVLTMVMVNCWGTSPFIAECQADGMWHPHGMSMGTTEGTRHLCQPSTLNDLICGKRARYIKPPGRYIPWESVSNWSWLAGLFRHEKYACTATIISPYYLLTAAHCLTRSQETSQEVIDLRDLRVQHLDSRGKTVKGYVTAVHLYPGYVSKARPSRDIALIRLERPISFSRKVAPACVLERGFPQHFVAATFNRTVPHYRWELILQEHDPRCHSPFDRCASRLEIDRDQFCGIDKEYLRYLPQGSSGGPYLVNMGNDVNEKWTVVGIVSSSYDMTSCTRPYTIFTSVSNYWPWIERCVHMGDCSLPSNFDQE